jgi:primosomal protein N'
MPLPQHNWNQQFGNHLILEQLDYDHVQQAEEAEERKEKFNAEQQAAFDQIMAAVESKSGQCFFLHGPGGTGKTFLYNTLWWLT